MSHRVKISIKNAPAEGFKLAVELEIHSCNNDERQQNYDSGFDSKRPVPKTYENRTNNYLASS